MVPVALADTVVVELVATARSVADGDAHRMELSGLYL